MSRKKIVAGNWKMNMTQDQSINLISELNQITSNDVEIKIAPSFTNLSKAILMLENSKIEVIAQNVHFEERGAFTGEISVEMLKSIGVSNIIIGHSERRKYFNETDIILSKKVKVAIDNSMKIIFCVGEELSEREKGNHFDLIKSQIINGLFELSTDKIKSIIVAYEPVWAIGTGLTASVEKVAEIHQFIRDTIAAISSKEESDLVPLLYGGSVNSVNAEELIDVDNVNGFLIGGASLDVEKFVDIINIVDQK